MRVIVTGSRDFADRSAVWSALDEQLRHGMPAGELHLIVSVGDCPTGADKHAREWVFQRVEEYEPVRMEIFHAGWSADGKAAGPIRNQRMVNTGGAVCLAFFAPPPATNRGTAGCVALARRAGIPVQTYGLETETTEQETLI